MGPWRKAHNSIEASGAAESNNVISPFQIKGSVLNVRFERAWKWAAAVSYGSGSCRSWPFNCSNIEFLKVFSFWIEILPCSSSSLNKTSSTFFARLECAKVIFWIGWCHKANIWDQMTTVSDPNYKNSAPSSFPSSPNQTDRARVKLQPCNKLASGQHKLS